MTSIHFLTVTNYGNQFKCNYLITKKLFVNFFPHFSNLDQILNILKKIDDPRSLCISEITDYERRG